MINEMIPSNPILEVTPIGLYCKLGGFYIDPQSPVEYAVVTHAHSDHARWGCRSYLAAARGEQLLRMRMSNDAAFRFLLYGEAIVINGVRISFHPAGHILGSAQIRLEWRGYVACVTGDYKLGADPTCDPWEPVPCNLMVTESTFGLPVYRWRPANEIHSEMNDWWRTNCNEGKCSILYGYALGKSQRLLACLDRSIGPIYTHGAVENGTNAYRRSGVDLPETTYVGTVTGIKDWGGSMVVAVPSANGGAWSRKFGLVSTAMASGWMAIRGARRRRGVDRGFVMSDHVDWSELLQAIRANNPDTLWVTHGYSAVVARYFREQGLDSYAIDNRGRSEEEEVGNSPLGEETAK
ncbi:MAG TPA: ligase-associated DNA damage response exonuclease [Pirellula sp.]|nr:ligase-associated DNA damage response exonuclease [Pirellula sp.]